MHELLHDVIAWLRDALGWIVLALAGGTLFALKRGVKNVRGWVGVLLRSCIVGVLAVGVIRGTQWAAGWQYVAVVAISFGSDALITLLDWAWTRAAADPAATLRQVVAWVTRRRIVVVQRNEEPGGEEEDKP